jgi:spore coat protein A
MTEITRRRFLQYGACAGAGLLLWRLDRTRQAVAEPPPAGTLDPRSIPKYVTPVVILPAMPRTAKLSTKAEEDIDYYEIGVRQFQQHILPASMDLPTTVWGYGSAGHPGSFNYPGLTIEARWSTALRVKWINQLVDRGANYLPPLLPVDQTLHWANPPAGPGETDAEGFDATPYMGPVPLVTHLHGHHSGQESDGFPSAWYLPAANNLPAGYATGGSFYDVFKAQAEALYRQPWRPGSAVFQYENEQGATTLWYHDHALGTTRLNVYAGLAGLYLLRGGPGDEVIGTLPRPAPAPGDRPGTTYYEIAMIVQDRSFNADGSLFYPDRRAFLDRLNRPAVAPNLDIPFIPNRACDRRRSDVPPIWNPEFFPNTMVVNGRVWPFLEVEQRRYRLRFLNACNSRFLLLKMSNGMPFWQIGADGGFLPTPVALDQLLLGVAERADVIVDFTEVAPGTEIVLRNLAPDQAFGGGVPGVDFVSADPETTGQVMQFRVGAATAPDRSTPPADLILPAPRPLPPATRTRPLSLNEEDSRTVRVSRDKSGDVRLDCAHGAPFGPVVSLLGTVTDGRPESLRWKDPITDNPAVGATEIWELHNFTKDAHPIHIHEIQFEVLGRQRFHGPARGPEPWETGRKDTVIALPGEITRVKATFDRGGLFTWHCHMLEHEDHEMMRPYQIGRRPPQHMRGVGHRAANATI